MNFRMILAAASFAVAISTSASAAELTGQIEAFCPGAGLPGLAFGKDEAGQDKSALAALQQDWPVGQGEAQFTSWSGKLYAVEWRKDVRDGANNLSWREAIKDRLAEQGWKQVQYPTLASLFAMDSAMAEKVVGGRTLVIEYDVPGLQLLRCGDLELMQLNRREMGGDLSPGSPRPVEPIDYPYKSPDPAECARPELIAAFARITRPDEIGPTIDEHFDFDDPALERATYQRRLHTWLNWKLRSEGGLDWEEISLLIPAERQTAPPSVGLSTIISPIGQAIEAQEAKDPRKLCEAGVAMLRAAHQDAIDEAEAANAINQALEAEARRLGIKLD